MSASTATSSSIDTAISSAISRSRRSTPSTAAARPRWAGTLMNARAADTPPSLITPAAIATVRNARLRPASAGWRHASGNCCDTSYFHVVFTLPHAFAPLCRTNADVLYNLLFRTSAQTMLEVAADPKHLGAEIGFLSILHTWGQNLTLHPHVHCIVPAGGLSPDHDDVDTASASVLPARQGPQSRVPRQVRRRP